MTLAIAITVPEGIVLASDSLVTFEPGDGSPLIFFNDRKIMTLPTNPFIGVINFGAGVVAPSTLQEVVNGKNVTYKMGPQFELTLPNYRLPVAEIARRLSSFYLRKWQETTDPDKGKLGNINCVVTGFDEGNQYSKVFKFSIPEDPELITLDLMSNGNFGMTWGGQAEILQRLIIGYDVYLADIIASKFQVNPGEIHQELGSLQRLPQFASLSMEDAIDYATFLIETTIKMQRYGSLNIGCGAPIHIATITSKDGLKFK